LGLGAQESCWLGLIVEWRTTHGYQSSVPEDAAWRLLSPRGPCGGCRAHPCRPGHAVRRIFPPLLAADLLLRRAARPAAPGQNPGRGARGVPRSDRRCGSTRTALPASGHVFGVRADRRQRDTLLLSWMAVRGGRDG